jgi:hypothetical protein
VRDHQQEQRGLAWRIVRIFMACIGLAVRAQAPVPVAHRFRRRARHVPAMGAQADNVPTRGVRSRSSGDCHHGANLENGYQS